MDARGAQPFKTSLLQKEEEKWNESWRGKRGHMQFFC